MFSGGAPAPGPENVPGCGDSVCSGTTPSMWIEFSVRPPAAESTPSILRIFPTAPAGNESCAARDERVSRELHPGLAEVAQAEATSAVLLLELLPLVLREVREATSLLRTA